MSDYRRSHLPGGTFFFTVITYNRVPLFANQCARTTLHNAWQMVQKKYPFTVDALCLLPNHIHCIWTLPEYEKNYPKRWKAIKAHFTRLYKQNHPKQAEPNLSRQRKGEAAIWQRRYWEHTIRDDQDYINHFDYIHYNPVKHGYVRRPGDWPWSTYHKYFVAGYYDKEWGDEKYDLFKENNNFGE